MYFLLFCLFYIVHAVQQPLEVAEKQWLSLRNYKYQSVPVLSSWYSSHCRNFYAEITETDVGKRSQQRQLIVLESFADGGRSSHQKGAQEVIISHEYKFVYVEVRKAASSSIRSFLRSVFNVDYGWGCNANPGCTIYHRRCSSLCLNKNIIQNYFFFTFVRHPATRFLAAYRQLRKHRRRKESNYTKDMENVLLQLLFEHVPADEHIQTQSFALSGSLFNQSSNVQMPLDFIGRVEHLENDFLQLLHNIEKHSGKILPTNASTLSHENTRNAAQRSAIEAAATPAIKKLATLTYAQDYVCLGYDASDHIISTFEELITLLHLNRLNQ